MGARRGADHYGIDGNSHKTLRRAADGVDGTGGGRTARDCRSQGGQADRLGLFQAAQGTRTLDLAVVGEQGRRTRHCRSCQRQHDRARAQKNTLQPHRRQHWVIPPKANSAFVAAMEDVLAVYTRPRERRRGIADDQGQQSTRTAPTGRTHDCKRPLRCTPNDLLPGGGGAAAAWPLAARAQQAGKIHKVGYLSPSVPSVFTPLLFDSLRELGWIEGKNVAFERRFAENRVERLPELAAELVRLNVDVIVATGTLGPLAAKRATSTIPIIMTAAGDPLGSGLVASLARPGSNVTGMSLMVPDLGGKRLELLKELLP